MSQITKISKKQEEKLSKKSARERALDAARKAAAEMRATGDIEEPEQLASGKSDENGNMTWEELDPDEK